MPEMGYTNIIYTPPLPEMYLIKLFGNIIYVWYEYVLFGSYFLSETFQQLSVFL